MIIAHRLSTIRDVDKIAVCSQGQIVEEGRYEELLKIEGGFFRALVAHAEGGGAKVEEVVQKDVQLQDSDPSLPGA